MEQLRHYFHCVNHNVLAKNRKHASVCVGGSWEVEEERAVCVWKNLEEWELCYPYVSWATLIAVLAVLSISGSFYFYYCFKFIYLLKFSTSNFYYFFKKPVCLSYFKTKLKNLDGCRKEVLTMVISWHFSRSCTQIFSAIRLWEGIWLVWILGFPDSCKFGAVKAMDVLSCPVCGPVSWHILCLACHAYISYFIYIWETKTW